MQKLRWYFNNEIRFENYTALYSDDNFVLVQNDNTYVQFYRLWE